MCDLHGEGHVATCDRLLREIRHENDLISHRLGWMMQANGFFYAAYALLATAPPSFGVCLMQVVLGYVGIQVIAEGIAGFRIAAAQIAQYQEHIQSIHLEGNCIYHPRAYSRKENESEGGYAGLKMAVVMQRGWYGLILFAVLRVMFV